MILLTGPLLQAMLMAAAPQPPADPVLAPSFQPLALPTTAAPVAVPEDDEEMPISYTYVELGVRENDVDQVDEDVDIVYLEGSLALGDRFYLRAAYEQHELDTFDTESDLLALGGGLHFPITPKLDVFGDIAWLFNDASSDLDELDDSESGYVIRGGGRWMPLQWDRGGIELQGNALWLTLDNWIGSEDEFFGYEFGGRVHFLKLFSLGAMYSVMEDDDQVSMNARLSF